MLTYMFSKQYATDLMIEIDYIQVLLQSLPEYRLLLQRNQYLAQKKVICKILL